MSCDNTQHDHALASLVQGMGEKPDWDARECSYCGEGVIWPAHIARFAPEQVRNMAMCDACDRKSKRESVARMLLTADIDRLQRAHAPLAGIADVRMCDFLRRWLDSDRQKGILIHGPSGFGKTTQIKALMREWINKTHSSAVYVTEIDAYDAMLNFSDRRQQHTDVERLMTAGLLVLDDIGVAKTTESRTEQIYKLIDARYRADGRTVMATNLDAENDESAESLWRVSHIGEPRVRRRMMDMVGKPVRAALMWQGVEQDKRPVRAQGAA